MACLHTITHFRNKHMVPRVQPAPVDPPVHAYKAWHTHTLAGVGAGDKITLADATTVDAHVGELSIPAGMCGM